VSAIANHADQLLFQKCALGDWEKYLSARTDLSSKYLGELDPGLRWTRCFSSATKYCGVVVTQCVGVAALTNHGSSSLLVAGLSNLKII